MLNRNPASTRVLGCVSACTLLVISLVASINLAVPMLAASALRPSSSGLLWIVDAYVVAFACLVIPGGAAGDRWGRKGVLVAGLLVFAAGASLSALATNLPWLLAARVVTGVGAALVLPNCVGVLVHATPAPERRRALAIWGAVSGAGGVLGNTLGGAVLASGSWRALFVVIVPIALACATWVAKTVPRSGRSERTLDPIGTALLVAWVVALLIGIIEGPERGWGSATVLSFFAISAAVLVVWVLAELRTAHPVLDPRLFRIPLLSSAALGMLVLFFGSFGLFFLNASLLQYGRGYPVWVAGLAIFPLTIPLLTGSRFVPQVVERLGVPVTLTLAFVAIGGGLLWLSFAVTSPYAVYAVGLFVIGVGFALAVPCLTAELTAALPDEQAGVAGGLQSATRELGSALGVAVVGTTLTACFTAHLPALLRAHDPVPRTVAQALTTAPTRQASVIEAFTTGGSVALQVASVVTLVAGAVVVWVAARHD